MKRLVFPFIGMLMFGLSGCFDNGGENIQDFRYIPSIVDYSLFGDMLNTSLGPIRSAEISNATDLFYGDPILAFFSVNYDQQTSTEYTVAYNFDYVKVNSATAEQSTGGPGFDLPIEEIDILGWVDNRWFFVFAHKEASNNDFFFYQMVYDNDEPIVYLRAKKPDTGIIKGVSACAFNMYPFFYKHMDADKKVSFSIKYKIGVDSDGRDEYKSFYNESGFDTFTITVE